MRENGFPFVQFFLGISQIFSNLTIAAINFNVSGQNMYISLSKSSNKLYTKVKIFVYHIFTEVLLCVLIEVISCFRVYLKHNFGLDDIYSNSNEKSPIPMFFMPFSQNLLCFLLYLILCLGIHQ